MHTFSTTLTGSYVLKQPTHKEISDMAALRIDFALLLLNTPQARLPKRGHQGALNATTRILPERLHLCPLP